MEFDFSVILDSLPLLLKGAKTTIYITVTGLIGGVIVGLVFGLMRAYGNAFVNGLATIYIELVRGTPIIVQVMFIYFALPVMIGMRVDALSAAIAAIVINAGAYIAEIGRGAFLSVPKGLAEAGLVLGVARWRGWTVVVGAGGLPQHHPA